jgi:Rrf2 family iron-sulfur cluster assembly transcriptional regulator
MLFPKFSEGLEAVLFIALNAGANPVSSKQICAYQDVLPRHLEPVLQILVKAGIIKGTKGPRGGYSLAREKRRILVDEIFSLLSMPNYVISNKKTRKNNVIKKRVTSRINNEISENITSHLHKITIEDLCKHLENQLGNSGKAEFNI